MFAVSSAIGDRRASQRFTARRGLPEKLLPAFRAALEALRLCGQDLQGSARLSRRMVEQVLTACENSRSPLADKLFAVLRRFEAEAAREEARLDAPTFLQEEPVVPAVLLDHMEMQAELQAETDAAQDDPPRDFDEEPFLVLTEAIESPAPSEARRRSFTIDFAALEAELIAA